MVKQDPGHRRESDRQRKKTRAQKVKKPFKPQESPVFHDFDRNEGQQRSQKV